MLIFRCNPTRRREMIITKQKRDIDLFVLQLGAVLAVSFAGFIFSRFKRIRPNLPPRRPKSSDHGYKDCSNKSIDTKDSETQKTKKEDTLISFPPRNQYDNDEKDQFLLQEIEYVAEKFDLFISNDLETPKSDTSVPLAFPTEEETDQKAEINRLRNTVRTLRERERCLEEKLLEYYSLKEQQKIAKELRSRLKLNQMETKVFNFKIKSLQEENEKLKIQCSEHSKVVGEMEMAKSQVQVLKKKLNINTQQHVEQILSLRERVAKLQENEIKTVMSDSDADKMMQRLKDLEDEIYELRDSNMRLELENFELGEKLESVQIIANAKLEDPEEIETLRHDANQLRSENEDLKREVEHLQEDRCTDLEQLVYLRWINACLRYELRTYQPPPGKTIARDLSTTLSPKSEEKAKQLILEYANDEDHIDYDQWSSSQDESSLITESMYLDDSSVDTLFATKKKSGKKKLMHKLMKILYGNKSIDHRQKRAGSSEPSSSSIGVDSTPRQLRSQSMDFQMLMRGKAEEEDSIELAQNKRGTSDSSMYGEESDENKKKELIKYAEALKKSNSRKKLHKKSVSFFF